MNNVNLLALYSHINQLAVGQRVVSKAFASIANPFYGSINSQMAYINSSAFNPKNETADSLEALLQLRLWTDSSVLNTSATTCSVKDQWVFNKDDCAYQLGSCTGTQSANGTCMIIQDCTPANASNRYAFAGCSDTNALAVEELIILTQQYYDQVMYEYITKSNSLISYFST